MKLKDWLSHAKGYYEMSKTLEDPRLQIKFEKADCMGSSWYLLHHSIELYLKALLINHSQFVEGHDLIMLLNRAKGLSTKVDLELEKKQSGRSIGGWIKFINPFGFPKGGIRYLRKGKNMHFAPLGISYFFTGLTESIYSECDLNKIYD